MKLAIDPNVFMKTLVWKALDNVLLKIAEECEALVANPNYPAPSGAALGVAMQLYLAEKITREVGSFTPNLAPVIDQFRQTDAAVQKVINKSSGDIH